MSRRTRGYLLALFFGYEHRFEAYVPKEKRLYGYFSQPVLIGDEIVAVLDFRQSGGKLPEFLALRVGDSIAPGRRNMEMVRDGERDMR